MKRIGIKVWLWSAAMSIQKVDTNCPVFQLVKAISIPTSFLRDIKVVFEYYTGGPLMVFV